MHDCDDKDSRRFEAVENTEGEPIDKTPANAFFHDRPGSRVSDDVAYARKDFEGEVVAEASFTILIVLDSRAELRLCLGVKREGHGPKRPLILANTSLPETAST